jgi:DNA-binding CsgD family transcriptional regulator/tetratricopeptide (TPR) repeat protein
VDAWPFVGRESELVRGAGLIARGDGAIIVGEAGAGKTALSRRLAEAATAGGRIVIAVIGGAVSSGTPFEAFAELLRPATRPTSTDSAADAVGVRPTAASVARDVVALAHGRPLLLCVDDVDRLDPDSGRVLLHLAAAGAAIVASTRGPALPEPADALWREGRCERWDLGPLSPGEVIELLESALGDAVDPSLGQAFARRSRGNPLLLRELVDAARSSGALRHSADGWRLVGEPPTGDGIHALFSARLATLDDDERRALELVAAGEPLPQPIALALIPEELLARLESDGFVAVDAGLDGTAVSSGHPLYGEVLRDDLSRLRLRRLRLDLARAFEDAPDPRPHDLVRAAIWRMADDAQDDPDRLLAAARAARSISLETAEMLARRAHETQGSLAATLLLAEILTHSGRTAEASALLEALPPDSLSARDREVLVYCAAVGGGLLTGDTDGGADMVAAMMAGDAEASRRLWALSSSLLAFDGRLDEALRAGGPIVEDEQAPADVRALAAVGAVGALGWLGRFAEALEMVDALLPMVDLPAVRAALPFAVPSLELLAIDILLQRGDLDAAEQRTRRFAEQADARDDPFARPRAEYCTGRLALLRGRDGQAIRCFRRCLAGLTPFDAFMTRHLEAMVATAAAALGREHEATEALERGDPAPQVAVYEPDAALARAAALAGAVRMTAAADEAVWAAGLAADAGVWTAALRACHDAARYGAAGAVLTDATTAAARVEGPLPAARLRYVRAAAARDAVGLEAAAEAFAALGCSAYAAEAMTEASHAHAAAGDRRGATRCGVRTAVLRADGDSRSPWLSGGTEIVPLTARERQVAALAGDGRTDAEIAERLGISVRTVQTHLAHVYGKLGITRRTELAARLAS